MSKHDGPIGRAESSKQVLSTKTIGGKTVRLVRKKRAARDRRGFLSLPLQSELVATRQKLGDAEERLIRCRGQLELLIDNIRDFVWIMDMKDRRITFATPSVEEVTGYTPEEMVGSRMEDRISSESAAEVMQKLAERMPLLVADPARQPEPMDVVQIKKDGTRAWTEVSVSFLRDEVGIPVIMVGVTRDIDARKRVEEALRQSEEKYRSIVSEMQEGICLHRLEYDCLGMPTDYRIVEVNEAYSRILGIERERAIGMLASELYGVGHAQYLDVYATVVATGEPATFETHFSSVDRHFRISVTRPKEGHFATIFSDMTAQKKAEMEQRKISRLDALSTLAGGIAHDFNNILAGVMGFAEFVSLAESDEERDESTREIKKACERGRALTGQLMTFSKGGALVRETESLKDLLIVSTKFALRGSKVEAVFEIPDELSPSDVSRDQIGQVIMNLVINAKQAMPSGTLIVRAENVMVCSEDGLALEPGRYVRISVIDSGTGINEDDLPRIFDPFFTTKSKGRGLGLASSYGIINEHDGTITVDSKLGEGTAFYIYLPASNGKPKDRTSLHDGITQGVARILLMDDEPILRRSWEKVLRASGYEVVGTAHGAEALEAFKAAREGGLPFDVVITDLTVPGLMGGEELIGKLREIDKNVKAIVVSGHSHTPVLDRFSEYGFQAALGKPFDGPDLTRKIAEVLGETGED